MAHDFKKIEAKWQDKWEKDGVFDFDVNSADDKFYVLVMFPYPSAAKLHMGHWYQYGLMDTWARYQLMTGKKLFFPMGFDAFGLPAENYAVKMGVHPNDSTTTNVKYMIEQFKKMGTAYTWKHILDTSKPDYYKWTQWVFLKLYAKGLAYRKEAPVNWCPNCQTVLANEQVHDGACERCDTLVTKKNLRQWFFKITDYAQRLLDGIDGLDWPHKTKSMQSNWIGRSEGSEIDFTIESSGEKFTVFTTRPDTVYGVTYNTFAPEHPMLDKITKEENKEAVKAYIEKSKAKSEIDRLSTTDEKTGVFTGAYAINPLNNEKVPIWVGDYVLYSYGTGVVMAVPAHDERDFAFAKKYNLEIKKVILEEGKKAEDELTEAFVEAGKVINSDKYNDMLSTDMIPAIIKDMEGSDIGRGKINFRLHDWLVSRQRYWGSPIPIVYCEDCGEVPIPEKDLPVCLPEDAEFKPTGESPLATSKTFMHTTCPKCGKAATREPDTLDTFVCSSWYFLRYPSTSFNDVAFDKEITKKMLPVDKYCGGAEHACMHLLYARFITMALKDAGFIDFEEPFPSLTHQGLVLGPDGQKMSKSKGNSVSPDQYVEDYGSDVLRLYLSFGFNYIDGGPWDDTGFKAMVRFSERLVRLFEENENTMLAKDLVEQEFSEEDKKLLLIFHNTIKMSTIDTDRFMFNTSVARFMELYNGLTEYLRIIPVDKQNKFLLQNILKTFVVILAPFAPHLSEELWEKLGNSQSVFKEAWPKWDEKYLHLDTMKLAVMVNGKLRGELQIDRSASEDAIKETALEQDKVIKHSEGKTLAKHIYVKEKLINLIFK
ncbi:MAG: leucine--tRNA ligase [Pseudomonadota bacterium]